MSRPIRLEEAVRLRVAESRWLDQARARLHSVARPRPARPRRSTRSAEEATR